MSQLPDPGQSLFDLIAFGGRDPKSFEGLEPTAAYVEKLQLDGRKRQSLPKTSGARSLQLLATVRLCMSPRCLWLPLKAAGAVPQSVRGGHYTAKGLIDRFAFHPHCQWVGCEGKRKYR